MPLARTARRHGRQRRCPRDFLSFRDRVANDDLPLAVPYNPGRYIRLEKEPTTNQEVAQFRSDLRNLITTASPSTATSTSSSVSSTSSGCWLTGAAG